MKLSETNMSLLDRKYYLSIVNVDFYKIVNALGILNDFIDKWRIILFFKSYLAFKELRDIDDDCNDDHRDDVTGKMPKTAPKNIKFIILISVNFSSH